MPNPAEMALSLITFGVRRTEAVVRGVAGLGLSATRTVLGAAVRAATGNGSAEAPAGAAETPAGAAEAPAGATEAPAGATEAPAGATEVPAGAAEAPASTAEADPVPDSPSEASPTPDPDPDPERKRRIALRDQPIERAEPHHALNNPVSDEPDPTEWPDPYDPRDDPRDPDPDELVPGADAPHTPTGSQSTSAPHPSQDPQAERWNGPKRRT